MKLELKHLAPYYPYGMKVKYQHTIKDFYIIEVEKLGKNYVSDYDSEYDFIDIKPILRPLSDLSNDQETFKFLLLMCHKIDENLDYVCEFSGDLTNTSLSYRAVLILIVKHYDVFGLIEKGLAIDINTLEK